jgi:hypothetical protein
MFHIKVIVLNLDGSPATTAVTGNFESRPEAVKWLDEHIEKLKPASGYKGEQDYWWSRDGADIITRYVIVTDHDLKKEQDRRA